ncbi:hypothetical protein ASZ78_015055 [Callipepla squamata]|uniref:Kelch domain-containing protein n=1 Tax=Callipepla squamata TaxID=9009 RepID=A0A226NDG6_CALSU|nr:hypothetical protein ASZ78_015055 [Callipepla squamata]
MLLSDLELWFIARNEWEMLECPRDGPEELEEHSMVAYEVVKKNLRCPYPNTYFPNVQYFYATCLPRHGKCFSIFQGTLYIFGGMVDSAFTQAKSPLWIYDTDSARWTEGHDVPAEMESSAPTNRRGHSAVVYCGSMYIYGGYVGIRGVSQEFWTFHFDRSRWLHVATPSRSTGPGPRHGHSAVVYHTAMYLFGGLMGLSEQRDVWQWDFGSRSWSNIRTRYRILFVKLY